MHWKRFWKSAWGKVVPIAVCLALLGTFLGIQVDTIPQVKDGGVSTIGIGFPVLRVGTVEAAGTADYVCDGTDDNVQIQAALNALPSGGKLVILTGNYVFAATVTRLIDNVQIEGVGRATYISYDGVTPVFTAGGDNWVFTNLRTDAGGINMGATTGWMWTNVAINVTYYAYRSPYGSSTFNDAIVASLTDSGLTNGRIPIAGLGGLLGDDADLSFSGNQTIMTSVNATEIYQNNFLVPKASGAPDYVVGANTATDDVAGSTGYWVKSGSTGQVAYSGASMDAAISTIFTAAPNVTVRVGNLAENVTGKQVSIGFQSIQYTFTSQWSIPAGSIVTLIGMGSNPGVIVSGDGLLPYNGGTEFRFTGTTYPVFVLPKSTGGVPATILNIQGHITWVVNNPAAAQANTVYAFNLDGLNGGYIDSWSFWSSVGVLATGYQAANIKGVSLKPGNQHDKLVIQDMEVWGFRANEMEVDCDHLQIGNLGLGGIHQSAAGDSDYALSITDGQVTIDRLHIVVGIRGVYYLPASGGLSLTINSMSVETMSSAYNFMGGGTTVVGDFQNRGSGGTCQTSDFSNASIGHITYYWFPTYGGNVRSMQGIGIGGFSDLGPILNILGDARGVWPFFETLGAARADYSAYNHDATLSLSGEFAAKPLIKGRGAVTPKSGATENITVADSSDFTFSGAFSVVFAGYINGMAATQGLVTKSDYGANPEWAFVVSDAKPQFVCVDTGGGTWIGRTADAQIAASTWHVLVATWNGTATDDGIKLYHNGLLIASTSAGSGGFTAMGDKAIGLGIGNDSLGTKNLDCSPAFAAVTAKELSASEVWALTKMLKAMLELP